MYTQAKAQDHVELSNLPSHDVDGTDGGGGAAAGDVDFVTCSSIVVISIIIQRRSRVLLHLHGRPPSQPPSSSP